MTTVKIYNTQGIQFARSEIAAAKGPVDVVVNIDAYSIDDVAAIASAFPHADSVQIRALTDSKDAQRELLQHIMTIPSGKVILHCDTVSPSVLYEYAYDLGVVRSVTPRAFAVAGQPGPEWTKAMTAVLRAMPSIECLHIWGGHVCADSAHSFVQALSMNQRGPKKMVALTRATAEQCRAVAIGLLWSFHFVSSASRCVKRKNVGASGGLGSAPDPAERFAHTHDPLKRRNVVHSYFSSLYSREEYNNASITRRYLRDCDVDDTVLRILGNTLKRDKTLRVVHIDRVSEAVSAEACQLFAESVAGSKLTEVHVASPQLFESIVRATPEGHITCALMPPHADAVDIKVKSEAP